ncbi:Cytochrome c-type biogenesis protein CcmC, putative heme lyase for CcmE [Bathymodiolus thermophilus thioautotrophic gill symbiont]|uniref:Heme exporter protein C n=1 Tax=Bathymodiolus thermophilus thioautotrophic gill symbiont TaxID=2360 RepID=A0A1J5U598_9GAMM|nr:heme ABC transporter permease [Bathymodiolus thermophilus thioautotrophic gill symbiont]AYQ56460.1 Heme exporter protein CcmC [Bathymodiolus thermophilus thioautotrophic gill symbiont]OIR23990.1 heme ABC transporter permease [Bathymodiolus thermophilus thioautotrophic gill symbiont]CAB5496174.1 Cytochrome c-type biogenesis protein CcmC, putative heme lyase for CcmE [Bathymodiolus thermophilus thioautotrophic gill symbiont]CAB5496639.1 Cytochrome c-type biogenesis protein CcmC, putative heme 
MWKWIQAFASPQNFYQTSAKIIPWFMIPFVALSLAGLYWGLVVSPADYQQGDSVRIMYVHVPAAWMSLFIYMVMAISGAIGLIWQIKLAHIVAKVSAPIGALFTLLALITGSIWGKPMWGTWWVWDARLTSELILLFLYLAYMSLNNAFDNPKTASKASAILAIVGLVNIPIIYYSVEWWNSLHQGSSIGVTKVSMQIDMFISLMLISFAFKFLYGALMLMRARDEVLVREQNSRWVRTLIEGKE